MGLEQKSVSEIVEAAVKGAFNIPEFQRGFVWRADQVRDLIESLHRDFPVGSMLVWDSSAYDIPRGATGAQTLQWVVDGQQRTTALCIAFNQKPYWWPDKTSWDKLVERVDVYANVGSPSEPLEFALTNPVRRKDPHWFSVRRALRCQDAQEAATLGVQVAGECGVGAGTPEFTRLLGTISGLWAIRARVVPLISVQHDVEDVAEIFARLNQAGTRVTEADVTVALVAASNPSWVRDEFLSYSSDLADSGYDLEPGVYIRTLTGVAEGTARLKDIKSSFWRDDVPSHWPKIEASVTRTVRLLKDRGVLSAQILPSRNSLIPLFAFQAKYPDRVPFERAFRWLLMANADGRYSGSSTTTLSQDLATIRDAAGPGEALEQLTARLRVPQTIGPDRFLEDYRRSRFGRLLLYLMLFDRSATDWVSKVKIGYEKGGGALNEGFLPEWHHIFPRAVLRKNEVSEDDANFLANITVLNEATNRNKLKAKPPARYVADFSISDEDLRRHVIPTDASLEVAGYSDFVLRRAQLLADAANEYLDRLSVGQCAHLPNAGSPAGPDGAASAARGTPSRERSGCERDHK